jgi:hypothetical protein
LDPKQDRTFTYESGVLGTQSSEHAEIKVLPKARRAVLAKATLRRLGIKPTSDLIETLLKGAFALYWSPPGKREAVVTLTVPFKQDLPLRSLDDSFRSTLVHEIAHVLDEGIRLKQIRSREAAEKEFARGEANIQMEEAAEILGLPMPPPPPEVEAPVSESRRKKEALVPTADYYNLPQEVTARLPEIFDELDRNASSVGSHAASLVAIGTPRDQVVLSTLRWWSPTFRSASKHWSDTSLKRVLRAVYDRYHDEPWFPKATGVYKNSRRTSRRRRTSRK